MYARVSADVYGDSIASVKLIPSDKSVDAINMYWSAVVFIARTISVGTSECICCC